ncbi:MAG: toprim domain-containing protein, partial [Lysobacter sp.]
MRPPLHSEVFNRLVADYGFKVNGAWMQEGQCPDCAHKELYAHADGPWIVRCGRTNKCGSVFSVKDLYRDLFESWSDRYLVTEVDPHAAADAYLQLARGFDLKRLRGTYTQESYFDRERNLGSATVRFALEGGGWWERIIDRPERFGKRKANFAPGIRRAGQWWQLPDSDPDADELWLAEGIFDAYALELNGVAARALMSSNNYPEHALAALLEQRKAIGADRPVLVWALDGDASGRRFTRQWIDRARSEGWDCKAAQIPQSGRGKIDWNDQHQRGRLAELHREDYLHEGALLVAESAIAKALLMYKRRGRQMFHFGFDNRLFWFTYNDARYQKAT